MARERKKYVGITRAIDPVGRLVIPSEFRKELGIDVGEEVEIRLATISKQRKVIEVRKKEKENEN